MPMKNSTTPHKDRTNAIPEFANTVTPTIKQHNPFRVLAQDTSSKATNSIAEEEYLPPNNTTANSNTDSYTGMSSTRGVGKTDSYTNPKTDKDKEKLS